MVKKGLIKKKKSKIRKLFSILIVIIITLICIELISPLVYKQVFNRSFDKKEIQKKLLQTSVLDTENIPLGDKLPNFVKSKDIHPYIGFTHPISQNNKFGFKGPSPIVKQSSEKVNICILGGSFAEGLYLNSKEELINQLKKSELMKNKTFEVVVLAMGGFKQPQQLFALTFFLFLGAQYDIVINIDGFNELALPYTENVPFNTQAYFPRTWFLYSIKTFNIDTTLQIAKIYGIRKKRFKVKKFFSASPFYHSKYLLLLWSILDNSYEADIRIENQNLTKIIDDSNYKTFGSVAKRYNNQDEMFEDFVSYWKNSSIQIHNLSKANNFIYLHFLQPNQYVPNSKTFSQSEKENALTKDPYKYKDAVLLGYHRLIEEGKSLFKGNLNFTDLTMIFKDDSRTLYIDKCCHLNKEGYDTIAKVMAQQIIQQYESRSRRYLTK